MPSAPSLAAQDLEDAQLLHPAQDSWPSYHGDYSGERHIHLTQITPQNVGDLALAWAFQTNQGAEIKSSPLLVDGVIYFTVPDNIWAVDEGTNVIMKFNPAGKIMMILGHRPEAITGLVAPVPGETARMDGGAAGLTVKVPSLSVTE